MKHILIYTAVFALLLGLSVFGKYGFRLPKLPESAGSVLGSVGRFSDLMDRDGYVVGLRYEALPQELRLSAKFHHGAIALTAALEHPEQVPFSEARALQISRFEILDETGKVLTTAGTCETAPIQKGTAAMVLQPEDLEGLKSGTYGLRVRSLVGLMKASEPLEICGDWSASFTI